MSSVTPAGSSEEGGTPPDFTESFDARDWARAFMERFRDRKQQIDEADMLSWFANALMRGYDERGKSIPLPREEGPTPRDWRVVQAQELLGEVRDLVRKIGDTIPGSASEMGALAAELASAHDELYAVDKELRSARLSHPAGATDTAKDAERWRALVRLVDENHMHKGLGGGIILAAAPANEFDKPWASVQAIDHENPRNTLWIFEAESLDEAIDAARKVAPQLAAARSQGGREGTE